MITSLVIVDNVFMSVNKNEHIREVKLSIIDRRFMTSFFSQIQHHQKQIMLKLGYTFCPSWNKSS